MALHHQPDMDREERVIFCGLVGMLLIEDGIYSEEEHAFFDALLESFDLNDEEMESVYDYARNHSDPRPDIERLRRGGHSDALMDKLREAALADGSVQAEEQALIDSIDEIIRLRLGAKHYPVALEGLNAAPLEALYDLEERLGQGGFGVVVKARDKKTGQALVIKRLRLQINRHTTAKKRNTVEDRFWREVAILGQLTSPYSVRLLGAGFDVDTPYMVLEYIEGDTLRTVLKQSGQSSRTGAAVLPGAVRTQRHTRSPSVDRSATPGLDLQRTRRIMMHVLHAIADAHTKGVIHRDLKPDNIMLSGSGSLEVARVLDFGLAGIMHNFSDLNAVSVTGTRDAVGTPSYMPPEQIMELKIKRPESDVYALGIILLECLTGKRAIKGPMGRVVKWQLSKEPVAIPAYIRSTLFGPIIAKATQKDHTKRYPSAVAMLEAFEALPHDESIGRSGIWTRLWSGFKTALGAGDENDG